MAREVEKRLADLVTIANRATEIRALAHQGLSMASIARKLDLGYASVHRVVTGSAFEGAWIASNSFILRRM